jgi:hypothetical protein
VIYFRRQVIEYSTIKCFNPRRIKALSIEGLIKLTGNLVVLSFLFELLKSIIKNKKKKQNMLPYNGERVI